MSWCWSKQSRRSPFDNVIADAEFKVRIDSEKCAKTIREVVCNLQGVQACTTDVDAQNVVVVGNFNLEKVLKILKKRTGKRAEILSINEKSDIVQKKKDGEPDKVQKEDKLQIKENDDKPETSVIKVEFKIPTSMCDKYKVYIGKVISKFEGVETCVVDVENKKVVVTGNFDPDKLRKKLKKKIRKLKKKDEESKTAAEKDKELEMYREMYAGKKPNSDEENEMDKYIYLFSDSNPNGCSIS